MMQQRWKDVKKMVLALLSDKPPEGQATVREYEDNDLVIWWNNAQMRFAVQKPFVRHQVYESGDGLQVSVPQHHYRPRSVYTTGRDTPLPRLRLENAFAQSSVGFYLYEDTITLSGFQTPPTKWLYIYQAYYPKIVNDDSRVGVPEWAHEALANYVGMQAMALEAIEDARYRKFVSPVDAPGNPQHNPFLKVAEYYHQRYLEILNTHVDDDEDFRQ